MKYENKLEAMVNDMSAHTWEQERAAVVAWMAKQVKFPDAFPANYARRVERGEHWPEGDKPNGIR
jgi:hypothetical protein